MQSVTPQKKQEEEVDDVQLIESVLITEKAVEEEGFELYQNYPNPFLNETSIQLSSAECLQCPPEHI